jgi:hypothetical protein
MDITFVQWLEQPGVVLEYDSDIDGALHQLQLLQYVRQKLVVIPMKPHSPLMKGMG